MMLSTGKLKVIHVTTHIGLLDAIERIEPGLVERTIRRGHAALGQPHGSASAPSTRTPARAGCSAAARRRRRSRRRSRPRRADGIDAHGPLPADTAFFLAGRGDYDLIVAMYHDQGHGPVKVLGIEAGREHHRRPAGDPHVASTTAPRSTSPARAWPTTAAWSRRYARPLNCLADSFTDNDRQGRRAVSHIARPTRTGSRCAGATSPAT